MMPRPYTVIYALPVTILILSAFSDGSIGLDLVMTLMH